MQSFSYNIQLDKLFAMLELGDITEPPLQLSGGFLHKMFVVVTDKNKYTVKALNPNIMQRDGALYNFIISEKIATIAKDDGIEAVPALMIKDNNIYIVEGQFYMIFPFIDGEVKNHTSITVEDCNMIGKVLARLHSINYYELCSCNHHPIAKLDIDWKNYRKLANASMVEWASQYSLLIDRLEEWTAQANNAITQRTDMVISHRDLDPKNVMWQDGRPIIIDWESAGETDPMQELIEVATSWASDDKAFIDEKLFFAVIEGYEEVAGKQNLDWNIPIAKSLISKLQWLEYNIKRSLGIECADLHEQSMGTQEVISTMNILKVYSINMNMLVEWLEKINM